MAYEVEDGASSGPSDLQRSLKSQYSTFVGFENHCKHSVEVIWLDYKGQPVWYNTLRPGQNYQQQTYVTHPWVCVESDTGRFELMEINSREILYPEKKHIRAVITEPRRTLYELCVICVRNHLRTVFGLGMLDHLMEDKVHRLSLIHI